MSATLDRCDTKLIEAVYRDVARWPGILQQVRLSLSGTKPGRNADLSPQERLVALIRSFNATVETFHKHRREFRSVDGLHVKAEGGKLVGPSWAIASYETTRRFLLSCVWYFERRHRKRNLNPEIRAAVDSIEEYEYPPGYEPTPDYYGNADNSPYLIFNAVLPGIERIPEDVANVVELSGCQEFFANVLRSLGIDGCAVNEVAAGVEAEWHALTNGRIADTTERPVARSGSTDDRSAATAGASSEEEKSPAAAAVLVDRHDIAYMLNYSESVIQKPDVAEMIKAALVEKNRGSRPAKYDWDRLRPILNDRFRGTAIPETPKYAPPEKKSKKRKKV